MSKLKLYHSRNYYRLSSDPESYDHLILTIKKQLKIANPVLYYLNSDNKIVTFTSEDFVIIKNEPGDKTIYLNEIPSDLLEYEDLSKSFLIPTFEDITKVIQLEINKNNKISTVHIGHLCEKCFIEPIVGVRFYCNYCKISLCGICEKDSDHPHDLLKLKLVREDKPNKFGRIVFDAVRKMKELGFDDDIKVRNALVQAGYNVEIALSILLN